MRNRFCVESCAPTRKSYLGFPRARPPVVSINTPLTSNQRLRATSDALLCSPQPGLCAILCFLDTR